MPTSRPVAGPRRPWHWLALGIAVAIGLGSSLSPSSARAATVWQDTVGAQTPDKGIQALAYLPNDLWIDAGDSIAWKWGSDEPHTVSLGPTDGVSFQTPETCNGAASSTHQCTWNGSGLVTSGALEDGATFTVTFPTAGTFTYKCLLHSNMTGTAHVQAAGAAYPHDQRFYDRQGTEQTQNLIQRGQRILERERDAVEDTRDIIVGNVEPVITTSGGSQSILIPRFVNGDLHIRVGQTLTWTAPDTLAPHTVTFGVEPSNVFAAVNLTGPGESTTLSTPYPQLMQGPTVSAGVIGDNNAHGTTFKATFTTAGTYKYYCAIHDELGMVGTIQVLANNGRGDDEHGRGGDHDNRD